MLFAELADVLTTEERWLQVRLRQDGQTGWVDRKMLTPLSADEQRQMEHDIAAAQTRVMLPMAYAVSDGNGQTIPLSAGTRLPNYDANGKFTLLGALFRIDPAMVTTPPPLTLNHLMKVVRFFLNIPYLWGGKNAMGLDCSGFTQVVHSIFGHSLLRNASEQATQGEPVSDLSKAQAGDLAFFNHADLDPDATHISHVGILLDSQRIIHCSGRVKVEKIDDRGIFSAESGGYTHHLHSIRRI